MANTAAHASAIQRHEPSWWNDQHSRAWDRVKDAFARDWEQTQPAFPYDDAEPALRFGYGASTYYFDHDVWDLSLEAKLRDDWSEIDADRDWKTVRDRVRVGWERARGTRH